MGRASSSREATAKRDTRWSLVLQAKQIWAWLVALLRTPRHKGFWAFRSNSRTLAQWINKPKTVSGQQRTPWISTFIYFSSSTYHFHCVGPELNVGRLNRGLLIDGSTTWRSWEGGPVCSEREEQVEWHHASKHQGHSSTYLSLWKHTQKSAKTKPVHSLGWKTKTRSGGGFHIAIFFNQ